MRISLVGAAFAALALPACAQQGQTAGPVMATVDTSAALVTGGLEVAGQRARLLSNASVTAYDRTAPVALTRGGEVLVCSTSQFHLLHSGLGPSLLFGLDRGAIELHTRTEQQDVILTPDIRFTIESPGSYDLSLRVTNNGDTCVANEGNNAPTLLLNDAFSPAVYRLTPGQHVLFEHGSLREVVDHETSPCGCPQVVATPAQVAAGTSDAAAALTAEQRAKMTPQQIAAAEHPFPEAQSQGLAPTPMHPAPPPPGQTQTQIAETLVYGHKPAAEAAPAATAAAGSPSGTGTDNAPPPPAPPKPHDVFHAIGRFFHRLFHPGEKPVEQIGAATR